MELKKSTMRNIGAPMVAESGEEDHFFSILNRSDLMTRAPGARRLKAVLKFDEETVKSPRSVEIRTDLVMPAVE